LAQLGQRERCAQYRRLKLAFEVSHLGANVVVVDLGPAQLFVAVWIGAGPVADRWSQAGNPDNKYWSQAGEETTRKASRR
jgi:hypothetical protein